MTSGAVLAENFWGRGPWKVSTVERQKIELHNNLRTNYCNVITCIGGKTGGLEENCPPPAPAYYYYYGPPAQSL